MATGGFDLSSLDPLKQQASSASSDAANLAGSAPQMLDQLKANLTGIFAKNNPLIDARNQSLADFLSTPARSRAEYMPSNMQNVEGSPLNLSPTQQNAITVSRSSAALAPLAGLNNIITGLYGNIPQAVEKAGGLYQSQIDAARLRAANAQQQYQTAYAELAAQEDARRFNAQEARLGQSSQPLDLATLIQGLQGNQQSNNDQSDPYASAYEYSSPQASAQKPATSDYAYNVPQPSGGSIAGDVWNWLTRHFNQPAQQGPQQGNIGLFANGSGGGLSLGGYH